MDSENRHSKRPNIPAGWIPIKILDEFEQISSDSRFDEIRRERSKEHPQPEPFKRLILETYSSQSGVHLDLETATNEELIAFTRWMGFQQFEGDLTHCFIRRWPRLQHFLYDSLSVKANKIAQRGCFTCHGGRPLSDLSPINFYAMRIRPMSRQSSDELFRHFQSAFKKHFENKSIDLGPSGLMCLALTFVLNAKKRDPDVDNMAKAVQDAFCRAITVNGLRFDDRFVHHLDVAKLLFAGSENRLYIRTAPSYINEHNDVVAPVLNHVWAGAERIEFEPPRMVKKTKTKRRL